MRRRDKRSREEDLQALTISIEEAIKTGRINEMVSELEEWEPYDLAVVYEELNEVYRPQFMNALEIETLTGMLSELSPMVEVSALYILSKEKAAQVLTAHDYPRVQNYAIITI